MAYGVVLGAFAGRASGCHGHPVYASRGETRALGGEEGA